MVDPVAEITVTSGATEAIFDAIQAVVRRDDEVIVFDPCYDSYEPSITLAGGRTIHLPLTQPDFAIDWERLARRAERPDAARHRELAAQSEWGAASARTSTGSQSCCGPTIAISSATRFTSTSFSTARGMRRPWRNRSLRSVALRCSRSARPITPRVGSSATASRRPRFGGAAARAPIRHVCVDVAAAAGARRVHDGASRASSRAAGVLSGTARLLRGLARRDQVSAAACGAGRTSSSRTTARSRRCPTWSSRAGSRSSTAWRRSPYPCSTSEPPDARLVRFCFAKENATLDAAAERLRRL